MHQLHFILFTWGHALKTSPGINRKSRVSYPGHDRKSRASYPGHEFLSSASSDAFVVNYPIGCMNCVLKPAGRVCRRQIDNDASSFYAP